MNKNLPYQIYPEHDLFVSKATRVITFDDLYDHVIELMSDFKFHQGMNGFYDFTQVPAVEGDLSKWHSLANGMASNEVISITANTAIVTAKTGTQVHQVMSEFLKLTANSNIDYQLFQLSQWQQAKLHAGVPEALLVNNTFTIERV